MLRMGNVDGIDDALLVEGKPPERLKQPSDARPHVQPLPQFPQLEIPVRTTFPQRVNVPLFLAVRTDGIIVVGREPSFGDKPLDAPRVHQHLKQVGEPLAAHAAGRCREP